MAQHNSRFNEYLPGDSPSDFSSLWAGGGTFTKQFNHVDRLSSLAVTGTGSSWSAITPDTLSSSTSGMLAVALIVPGATASPTIGVCLGGSTSSEDGFYLKVDPVNRQIDFRNLSSGTDSSVTPSSGTNPIPDFGFQGVPVWLEISYINSGIFGNWNVRVWNLGTPRPAAASVGLVTSILGGEVGLLTNASTDDYRVLSFSGVDNFDLNPALEFEHVDLTHGSLAMLADESDNISAYVSVDVHDPSTEITTTNHYGMLPHEDILGDGVGISGGLRIESGAGYSLIGDKYLDTQADKTYQLKLHNPPLDGDTGIYDTLAGKSTDGRLARLKLGSVDVEPRLWSPYMSGHIIGEPAIDTQDNEVSLTVGSATKAALNKQFPVPRYFGQRTWIESLSSGGGLVTITHAAEFNLSSFTISCLFRRDAGGSPYLFRKSGPNSNYQLVFLPGGTLIARYHVSNSFELIVTPANVCDGEVHTVVFSVLPGVHRYLMIDGEVVDEDSGSAVGTPDTNSLDIQIHLSMDTGNESGHHALLGAYTPPEQARSLFASRLTGSEPNVVGLWRLDDETGSTATDYSANGNDGTIAGTEGVNWDYVASDLGEPELAGRSSPLILGVPRQTLTHRSDYLRDRITHNYTETVDTDEDFRLKGVSTAETSNSDGVAEFGSSVSESLPITADHANNGGATEDPDNWLVSEIAETILTTAGLEIGNPNELITQAPLQAGIAFDNAPTYLSMLNATLTESGMCWYEDAYGRIVTSRLMTPISPGPVETYCVESLGDPDRNATTSSRGLGPVVIGGVNRQFPGVDPDITLAGWVRPLHLAESDFDLGSGRGINTFFELGGGFYVGINMLTGALVGGFEGDSIEADSNAIDWGEWNYVAASFNFFPGAMQLECTMTLFVKPLGGSAAAVASETVLSSSYSTTETTFHIGGVAGGYQRVSYIYGNLTAANLDSLAEDTDPTSNWDVGLHVWLNEGNSSNYTIAESEQSDFTSAPVYLHRCRWAPKAILDLNQSTAEWDEGPTELRPADEFIIGYDRAWHPLSDSDVAGSIKDTSTGDPSLYTQLTQRNKELRITLQTITDNYLDAARVEYDTPIVTKKGAEEIAKYAQLRWQAGRIRGVLSNLDRRFVAVAPMDEILLQSTRPSGMFPRSVRVYDIEFQKWDGRGPRFRAKVTG